MEESRDGRHLTSWAGFAADRLPHRRSLPERSSGPSRRATDEADIDPVGVATTSTPGRGPGGSHRVAPSACRHVTG